MCRWLAYDGPPIYLDAILFKPENSLIRQSLRALQSRSVTNGDGFGLGWYGTRREPGLYRDTLPAWNDENLRSLSEQIRAGLFLAHVRASTGTPISRSNCHPFRHGRWLFMHNGQIGEFDRLRRDLAFAVDPELFPCIKGATDSELFFHLLIGAGLDSDPAGAMRRAVATVEEARSRRGVETPFTLTASLTDGEAIYAVRYASDGNAPSLFYGSNVPLGELVAEPDQPRGQAVVILSEPLDAARDSWVEVPSGRFVTAGGGAVAVSEFSVAA
jgi:glutamine amidotransferase